MDDSQYLYESDPNASANINSIFTTTLQIIHVYAVCSVNNQLSSGVNYWPMQRQIIIS